jgi:hypothetical protein
MFLKQIGIEDIVTNSGLRRRITRFIDLVRLASSTARDNLRTTYIREAQGILRNIFGNVTGDIRRLPSILGWIAGTFQLLLEGAQIIRNGRTPKEYYRLAYVHASAVI